MTMRLPLCLAVAVGSSLAAQAPLLMPQGARVRIVVADSGSAGQERAKVTGLFDSLVGDTLLVRVGRDGMSRISRARVTSVAVANGRKHPYGDDAAVGMVIGLVLGHLVATTDDLKRDRKRRLLQGPVLGASIGLGAAYFGRTDWSRLSIPQP